MNYFGHAAVASWRGSRGGLPLGAMLPDFATMSGARVTGTSDANAFAKAWIEIGQGENPAQWQTVVDGIKGPVRGGVLGDFGIDVLRSAPKWVVRLVTENRNGQRRETRYMLNLG